MVDTRRRSWRLIVLHTLVKDSLNNPQVVVLINNCIDQDCKECKNWHHQLFGMNLVHNLYTILLQHWNICLFHKEGMHLNYLKVHSFQLSMQCKPKNEN